MPKRYTDAEVQAIVQETVELREYVKAFIKNQKDYVSEMEGLRKRNSDLDMMVTNLRKELNDQQTAYNENINKKVETMESTVARIQPDVDYIKSVAIDRRNNALEGVNSMWLMDMLRNSHPDYIRDLMDILENSGRRFRGRSDHQFMGTTPFESKNWGVDFSDIFGVHKHQVGNMAEVMKNLENDLKTITPEQLKQL